MSRTDDDPARVVSASGMSRDLFSYILDFLRGHTVNYNRDHEHRDSSDIKRPTLVLAHSPTSSRTCVSNDFSQSLQLTDGFREPNTRSKTSGDISKSS